ncbi:MAG: uroporphyrinogen decarboxylase family protein, partial [Leptonema sp. (in: bacteria)]
ISLDWRVEDITMIPENIAIQGNMDPLVLFGSSERVKKETLNILNKFSKRKNFIFNLGHGIYPNTPLHNVEVMVQTIKEYRLNE